MNNRFKYKIDISPFVREILSRLYSNRYKAYPVGGVVRDSIMGRAISDWDITTDADPSAIKKVFHDTKHFSLKHETVTLVQSGNLYEITTMKGANSAGKSIEEDLSCRDFTIDAMAYDSIDESIIDPFKGMNDIRNKKIRGVLDPLERFKEDPLRMLRAVRLSADLGFSIDDETSKAISKISFMLESVSKERIRDELLKLLVTKKPSKALNHLKKSGLIKYIIPELLEGVGKRQNRHHKYTVFRHIIETVDRIPPDPVLRISALLHDIAKPGVRKRINGEFRFLGHAEASAHMAKNIMKNLRFSNEEIKRCVNLIELHMIDYDEKWGDGAVRRLIRRAGRENISYLILLRKADLEAHGKKDNEAALMNELESRIMEIDKGPSATRISDLAVDGERVMEFLGIESGPLVGRVLRILLEKITDNPDLNNEKDLLGLMINMKDIYKQ